MHHFEGRLVRFLEVVLCEIERQMIVDCIFKDFRKKKTTDTGQYLLMSEGSTFGFLRWTITPDLLNAVAT